MRVPRPAPAQHFLARMPAHRRRAVAGRRRGVLRRGELERDRGLRPLRAARAAARGLRRGRAAQAAARQPRPRARCSSHSSATGALLALFGQTYQTGADVYELFLTWALLGLPLVIAAQLERGVGGLGAGAEHRAAAVLRLASRGWTAVGPARQRALPARAISLWRGLAQPRAVVCVRVAASSTRCRDWVRRIAISCAFVFGTWAGVSLRRLLTHDVSGLRPCWRWRPPWLPDRVLRNAPRATTSIHWPWSWARSSSSAWCGWRRHQVPRRRHVPVAGALAHRHARRPPDACSRSLRAAGAKRGRGMSGLRIRRAARRAA